MPGWRGMFCSWLAVQADQLASRESFSRSRELLSRHCSLAGCTRGLGRHQTGNTQQVEAMDVYLAPFIKHQKPDREVGTRPVKQGCPDMELHVASGGAINGPSRVRSGLDGNRLGGFQQPTGWLLLSFLTVLKEPGLQLIPLCQVVTLKQSYFNVVTRLEQKKPQ